MRKNVKMSSLSDLSSREQGNKVSRNTADIHVCRIEQLASGCIGIFYEIVSCPVQDEQVSMQSKHAFPTRPLWLSDLYFAMLVRSTQWRYMPTIP